MCSKQVVFCCCLALVFGSSCGEFDEEVFEGSNLETQVSELRVPGPWAPPAHTVAIAATQYVDVVNPPKVAPLGHCTSSNAFACSCSHPSCSPPHPGTIELDRYLRGRFSFLSSGGLYCCRQNSADTREPELSVHAIGRAIDLMVPMEGGDADNGLGDQVANWLVENAEFIGIQRVIWDRKYWNGERGFGDLSTRSLPHTNHIHVELSIDGAAKRTPFFTSGASNGSCTARCEGTRIINADCSSGDCGFYGAICIDGNPPSCGQPPPPEPPEAVPVDDAALPQMSSEGPVARFTPVPNRRLFDTRTSSASSAVSRGDGSGSGPLTAAGINDFTPAALPADASGVWLNLAAIRPAQPGYITAFRGDQAEPPTSTLNFVPERARANAAPLTLGRDGELSITTIADVDVVADLMGAFTPSGDGLIPEGPTRVLDTRAADRPLRPRDTREVDVRAPAGATGVVASVAVIGGGAPGYLTAFPCGERQPETSNINFPADGVAANTVISALGEGGKLCLNAYESAHVVVDVTGYLSPKGPLSYQPFEPRRLLDTRDPDSLYENRLGSRQVIKLPIQDLPGMPSSVWSVVANLTVVNATERGFLTAFPCGGSVPNTSSLNFPANDPVAALTVSSVGADGDLCIFASSRAHLIVDVLGVWTHDAYIAPPEPRVRTQLADQGEAHEADDDHDHEEAGSAGEGGADSSASSGGGSTRFVDVEPKGCSAVQSGPSGALAPLFLVALLVLRRRRAA